MVSNEINKQFHDLFKQKDRFIRFADFYVLDRNAAEDLVMDSFLYYWENREKADINGNLPAYILKVLKHKALDYLKLKKIHLEAHERIREDAMWDLNKNIACLEALEPYSVFTDECRAIVTDAVKQLPGRSREIFILSRVKGMKYADIAEVTGLSVKSVEYHMSKALKILREKLKNLYVLTFFFF